MFGVFHWLLQLRIQMHLSEVKYVPAFRLFRRYKTMNANTATTSNGPTMKYHCTVVLAEKTKKVHSYYGWTKNEWPKAKQVCFQLKFYYTQDCLQLKTTTPFKKTWPIIHATWYMLVPSLSYNSPFSVHSFSLDRSPLCLIIVHCENHDSQLFDNRTNPTHPGYVN